MERGDWLIVLGNQEVTKLTQATCPCPIRIHTPPYLAAEGPELVPAVAVRVGLRPGQELVPCYIT